MSKKYDNPCPCNHEWSHPQQDCTMYCDKYYAYLLAQDYNKLEAERDRLAEELEEAKAEIDGYKQYNQAVRHANEELRAENERLRGELERERKDKQCMMIQRDNAASYINLILGRVPNGEIPDDILGYIDSLEFKLQQAETREAGLREALLKWKELAHFIHSQTLVDWRTGEGLEKQTMDCIQTMEQALNQSPVPDRPDWPQIEGAEHVSAEKTITRYRAMKAVVEAARELHTWLRHIGFHKNSVVLDNLTEALNKLGGGGDVR